MGAHAASLRLGRAVPRRSLRLRTRRQHRALPTTNGGTAAAIRTASRVSDIPEAATIVAVADSFDAMTSDRPYKPGRSSAAAMQEIMACSGTQFSPRVVQALVQLYKQQKLPRRRRAPSFEEQAA